MTAMTLQTTQTAKTPPNRAPKVIVNEDDLAHLEALAEGAMLRNPALADRLLEELSRARIVKANKMPANVVSIGSTVTYRDEVTGQNNTVQLVYPEHADIINQRISIMTPIGVAILGLAEGAAFYWDTRDNQRRTLTIIAVAPHGAGQTPPPAQD
jgi:regulator of nucleoside diphosphate kinase